MSSFDHEIPIVTTNNFNHDNNKTTKYYGVLNKFIPKRLTTTTTTSTTTTTPKQINNKTTKNGEKTAKKTNDNNNVMTDYNINDIILNNNNNNNNDCDKIRNHCRSVYHIDGSELNARTLESKEKANSFTLPHLNNNNNHINNNNNNNHISSSNSKHSSRSGLTKYGLYRNCLTPSAQDDNYKLYTIYGNDTGDNDKLSGLPSSATGSLSSIITTSIASLEPEPGTGRSAGGGGGGGSGGSTPNNERKISTADGSADEKSALNRPGLKHEKWTTILMQVSIPFFLAGIGTIGAGIVLGRVEKWRVFRSVSELFILVPALLGLKGNLDMCLASRLSTQSNLGNMNSRKEIVSMIVGNISLVQVQATVASFLVAIFALLIGSIIKNEYSFSNFMLLIASSMFTATSSCFVLDFVLVAVILLSQKYNLNPDNMATPLAASIGDVVSISLFSFIASILYEHINSHFWITFVIVGCYAILLPVWVGIVVNNKYTRPVLKNGWVPVLTALCISGASGLVLDAAEKKFEGFVVFQPIINGIGGNLVSVHTSKMSTMLHQSSILGIIPPQVGIFEWPWRALFKGVPYAKTARILLIMSVPGNLLFVYVADYIHMSESTIGFVFVLVYLTMSLIQVMLLLYIAHILVHAMWKYKIDPDSASIPYLTALGDLFGTSLLAVGFAFMIAINQAYGNDLSQLNST